MAYPNNIETSNIGQGGIILSWYKAAIAAEDEAEGYGSTFYSSTGQFFPSFPFNRATFYNWLETKWSINQFASTVYNQAVPGTNWDVSQVIRWGKFKTFELALFGNVANGGDLGAMTLPVFNNNNQGRYGVNGWTVNSLSYLRYAFTRFESYGACVRMEESGQSGSESQMFFYKQYTSTQSTTRQCGQYEGLYEVDFIEVVIVDINGNPTLVHPDFVFDIYPFGLITIPNGFHTTQESLGVVTYDCDYRANSPHIIHAPLTEYTYQ